MGDFGCGDGGWTPAMKIDGTKVPVDRPTPAGIVTIYNHYQTHTVDSALRS